jgi:gliding motility-associated-like protein
MDKIQKHILTVIVSFFYLSNIFAQNQNSNWFFGNKAAISFNNGSPIALTTSQMLTTEGCASVSNPTTGSLLFYTNGLQIWDTNNAVMPNGSGLLAGANTSATQGTLILPYPGKTNLYYVFTVDEKSNNGANGVRYSIVDMNQNIGLGDVLPQQKNTLIQNNTTERISVTENFSGTGYWLVIHERNNNCFKSYQVNPSGINTTPVINNIGSIHSTVQQLNGDGTMGYMKISHDGKKIAVAIYGSNKIEIFDFDNCSGTISNPTSITTLDNPYGIEFSPDNSKLYFSLYFNAGFNGAIYQLNLSTANPTPQLIGVSSSFNNQCVGALQLAPDNKIYIAINGESWLSCISQPNNIGVSCGFIDQVIQLPSVGLFPTTGILGLPAMVLNQIKLPTILASNFCLGDSTRFELISNQNINSVSWNLGFNNSSTLINPLIIYPNSGTFNVSAIINSGCRNDTITKEIKIQDCDSIKTNCDLVIPNVFTPNNDGINENFTALIKCQTLFFDMNIYNRWGGMVWQSSNQNDSWDGKYNGKECNDGVYFYVLKLKVSSKIENYSGTITLIR